ncbi:MAG TPA: lactonase family protein [Terriglobia bacterium]|nr:lactonase family protein [Terriglobia bacterium]
MKTTGSFFVLATLLLAASARSGEDASGAGNYLVYVGTYTLRGSQGIYAYRFDAHTGELTALGLAAQTTNPSFLAVDPNRRFLYAVNELSNYHGEKTGAVSAFAIDRQSGKLTFLNDVSSHGAGPCYVSLDRTGKYVLVANYDSGSVAVFPRMKDGRLGPPSAFVQHHGSSVNHERQEGPHAHSIEVSPDNRFALTADLGLDHLLVYRFNPAKGTLAPNDPPFAQVDPGAGPRHFAFTPNGRFVDVVSEMGSSVTAFSYDAASGVLHKLQTLSMLPKGFKGENDGAEIYVHPNGKFVYASNRGRDSIAVFAIDAAKGTLTPVEDVPTQGKTPRHFAIDPTGSYLFAENQDSDTIVVFRIDPATGRLTATGHEVHVPSPVCLTFVAQ